MSEHSRKNSVGVMRIDGQGRNLLAVTEAQMFPCLSCVGRFVNPIAHRKIRPMQSLPACHIDNVRIRIRNSNGADRLRRLPIKDWIPRPPIVVAFPHPTIHLAHVEDIRLARNAGRGPCAASAEWANHAPVHIRKESGCWLLCANTG